MIIPMHLMTQRDQPIGSRRKCCERCGKTYISYNTEDSFIYVAYESLYTAKFAKRYGLTRCCDIKTQPTEEKQNGIPETNKRDSISNGLFKWVCRLVERNR